MHLEMIPVFILCDLFELIWVNCVTVFCFVSTMSKITAEH